MSKKTMPQNCGEFVSEVIRGVHVARARSLSKQFPQSIDDDVVDMCVNKTHFVVEYIPADANFVAHMRLYPSSQFLKASISFERLKRRYESMPSRYKVPGTLSLRLVRDCELFHDITLYSYVSEAD